MSQAIEDDTMDALIWAGLYLLEMDVGGKEC